MIYRNWGQTQFAPPSRSLLIPRSGDHWSMTKIKEGHLCSSLSYQGNFNDRSAAMWKSTDSGLTVCGCVYKSFIVANSKFSKCWHGRTQGLLRSLRAEVYLQKAPLLSVYALLIPNSSFCFPRPRAGLSFWQLLHPWEHRVLSLSLS